MKKIKRLSLVLLAVLLAMGIAACGGKEYVTYADYKTLSDAEWGKMTVEEINELLEVDGVLNEESTESWGEGYEVYDWHGDNNSGKITVLFNDDDGDGKMTPSSISTSLSSEESDEEE